MNTYTHKHINTKTQKQSTLFIWMYTKLKFVLYFDIYILSEPNHVVYGKNALRALSGLTNKESADVFVYMYVCICGRYVGLLSKRCVHV